MKVDPGVEHMSYMEDQSQSGGEDDSDFPSEFPSDYMESSGYHSGSQSDKRKSNKPIMEKRRRARINNCLNDLKGILLEAMRKDPARHSKLEKADILELTVRHLQNVQRNQLAIAMATDPTVLHRFKNGFSECATEVSRYMGRLDGVDPGIRQRLTGHLGGCVNGMQHVGPVNFSSPRIPYPQMPIPFQLPASPVTPNTHTIHPQTSNPKSILPSSIPSQSSLGDFNNNSSFPLNSHSPSTASTVTIANCQTMRSNQGQSHRINAFNLISKAPSTPPASPPVRGSYESSSDAQNPHEKGTNTTPSFKLGRSVSRTVTRTLDFSGGAEEGKEKDGRKECEEGKVRARAEVNCEGNSVGQRDNMWRPW